MPSENNKRIAKNTLMLYFRMLLIMFVSLYTVRVVLNALGIIDYGIYNVVGGIVVMLSFLSNSMTSASQRFFSFEIGRNDIPQLKRTFSLVVIIYAIISLVILLIAETIGLWFLNTQMVIPSERMDAANWIYQFSIFSFLVTIMTIPYNAIIISRENMTVYAYVSLVEAIIKLIIVYLLNLFPFDKLKLYSILTFLTTCIITLIYTTICTRKYKESHFQFNWDKKLFKTLITYSGWNLFGTISAMASDQGMNILLNIFFGPVINAARAIAYRVNAAITSFSQNFYSAVNPQIIKSYSIGDTRNMVKLVFQSTKFSYFLLLVISIPVFLDIEFILACWLKHYDNYMVIFTRLVIIYSLIISLENPLTQVARSTGKIKKYQIVVGSLTLLSLPISFFLLKFGYRPESTIYTLIVIYSIATILRLWVLKELVNFPISDYFKHVLLRIIIVSMLSIAIPIIPMYLISVGIVRFTLISILSIISVVGTVYFFGLTVKERNYTKETFYNRIKIIFHSVKIQKKHKSF